MNIALLSYEFPPDTGFGGIGTYTWYQARALVKLGHTVHVLAGAVNPGDRKDSEVDGVRIFRYKIANPWQWMLRPLYPFRYWWAKGRIENALSMRHLYDRLAKRYRYDALEMPDCGAEGFFLNHRIEPPTFIKFHGPVALIGHFSQLAAAEIQLCTAIEGRAIRNATALNACSAYLRQDVKEKMSIRKNIGVIPNGIDLELFDAVDQIDFRQKFGLSKDRPMILFAARLERRKGIHLCPEIAEKILSKYAVSFVFAGADDDRYMEKTFLPYLADKQLKGSAHYLGKLDMRDMRSAMRQTDIFLIPSLWENCPYSCLEAMAAGRAIVAANQGGLPELIEDEANGLLAAGENPENYTKQLARLIEDKNLRNKLGTAARQTIEAKFTDVRIAEKSAENYQQFINKRAFLEKH